MSATAFAHARAGDWLKMMEAVAESESAITARDEDERTLLHLVCSSGRSDVAAELLESGAELGAVDDSGWTPLHCAAAAGAAPLAELLLHRGADIHAVTEDGMSSVHLAASRGHTAVVDLLCSFARDERGGTELHRLLTCVDVYGLTALHSAVSALRAPCVDALVRAGASVIEATKSGETPLHVACEQDDADILGLLLKGKDTSQVKELLLLEDHAGNTPLSLAGSNVREMVTSLLSGERSP